MARSGDQAVGPGLRMNLLAVVAIAAPSFIMTALAPVLPMMAQFLGGGARGEVLAQQAQALPFLGLAIGGLLAGPLLTRLSLRRTLLIAAFAYGAGGLAAGLAQGPGVLLPGLFLLGLSGSTLNAGLAVVTGRAYREGPVRTRILGFQIAVSDAAAIVASMMAGVVAQYFGWRAAVAVYPIFSLYLLTMLAINRLPPGAETPPSSNGVLAALVQAWPVYLAEIGLMFLLGGLTALLPFHLEAGGLTTPGARAAVLTALPGLATGGSVSYGLIRGRIPDHRLLLPAIALSALGYVGLGLWHGGIPGASLSAAAIGLGSGFVFPMAFRAAFARVEEHLHGYSIGLVTTSAFLGAFAGPTVLGPVMRLLGAPTLFWGCSAAWLVVGGIVASRMRRRVRASRGEGGEAIRRSPSDIPVTP